MESGENPGRAGHCECGALFIKPLAPKGAEKAKSSNDAESGYLLCGRSLLDEVFLYCFGNIRQNIGLFCTDIFCLPKRGIGLKWIIIHRHSAGILIRKQL